MISVDQHLLQVLVVNLFLLLEKNLVVVSVDQHLLQVQQENLFLPPEKNLVVVSVDWPPAVLERLWLQREQVQQIPESLVDLPLAV